MSVGHSTTKPAQLKADDVTVVDADTGKILGHCTVDHYTMFDATGEYVRPKQRAQSAALYIVQERDEYDERRRNTLRVFGGDWSYTVALGPAPTHFAYDRELISHDE